MTKPIIAIDLDEVICDTVGAFKQYAKDILQIELKIEKPEDYNWVNSLKKPQAEVSKIVKDYHNSYYSDNAKPVLNSLQVLENLSKKFDFIVITSRLRSTYDKTKTWVDKNFPNLFTDIFYSANLDSGEPGKSKEQICLEQGVTALVEDRAGYLEGFEDKSINLFLLNCTWSNGQNSDKYTIVSNWLELEKHLAQLL